MTDEYQLIKELLIGSGFNYGDDAWVIDRIERLPFKVQALVYIPIAYNENHRIHAEHIAEQCRYLINGSYEVIDIAHIIAFEDEDDAVLFKLKYT